MSILVLEGNAQVKEVKIFDKANFDKKIRLSRYYYSSQSFGISKKLNLIAIYNKPKINIINIKTKKTVCSFTQGKDIIGACPFEFFDEFRWLADQIDQQNLGVWSLLSKQVIQKFDREAIYLSCLQRIPNTKKIVFCGNFRYCTKIRDVEDIKYNKTVWGHYDTIISIDWLEHQQQLVYNHCKVSFIYLEKGVIIRTIDSFSYVNCFKFIQTQNMFLKAQDDGIVSVCNLTTLKQLFEIKRKKEIIKSVDYLESQDLVVTGSGYNDGCIAIYKLKQKVQVKLVKFENFIYRVIFL